MAKHTPIVSHSPEMKTLMKLLGMPENVSEFTITGSAGDILQVTLTYSPSEDVFKEAMEEMNG